MKTPTNLKATMLAVLISSIFSPLSAAQSNKNVDTIFINGKIYTANHSNHWAEALAVVDDKIIAVGTTEEIQSIASNTTDTIDLTNHLVLPGLIDAHVHAIKGSLKTLFECNFAFTSTPEEIKQTISDCVQDQPEAKWIRGGQWTSDFFNNYDIPSPRAWLDEISGDKAIVIVDDSGHNHWLNSAALREFQIDKDTPSPEGGEIVKNTETGEPTGILKEMFSLVRAVVPRWNEEQHFAAAQHAVNTANAFGITAIKGAGAREPVIRAFAQLADTGHMTADYAASIFVDESEDSINSLDVEAFIALRDKYADSDIDLSHAKIYLDGVPTASRTAAMISPYVENGQPTDVYGPVHIEEEILSTHMAELDAAGFTIRVHTAGDRAVRETLNAIEYTRKENGNSTQRHELAHAGYIDPDDIPRFAELNAVADFSPYIWFPSPIISSIISAVGEKRGEMYWPTKDLLENNAPILMGSDWPSAVADMNPWIAIESLVTRANPFDKAEGKLWPEQAISLEEAIQIATVENAKAMKLSDEIGSLEVGKKANFIVLNQGIFSIDPFQIGDTNVLQTYFEGEMVYEMK